MVKVPFGLAVFAWIVNGRMKKFVGVEISTGVIAALLLILPLLLLPPLIIMIRRLGICEGSHVSWPEDNA